MIQPVRRLRRLLVLLPSAGLGGAEAHTATLVRALAATGVAVTVAAAPGLQEGLARMMGDAAALRPAPVAWREAEDLAANGARQARAAEALIHELRPDAALVPLPWPSHGLGLQLALARAGIPMLAVAHLAPPQVEPVPDVLRGDLASTATAWAAVSAPVAQRLAATFGLPPGSVAVVPNAVAVPPADPARRAARRRDRRAALSLGPDAPLVLFAGRLEEKKGADLLPALAERLRQETGGTLAVLGTGPLQRRLSEHPASLGPGLGPPLRLQGQVTDVADWLLAADVLVLPSRLEGCPLIFLEATALGCPVVATAAALECFGAEAADFACIAEQPTVVALTSHIGVMLTKPRDDRGPAAAALAHQRMYDRDFMLGSYFTLLRACHAAAGRPCAA